jgi:hypothetical protein
MTKTQDELLREFVQKWRADLYYSEQDGFMISDLTALIEQVEEARMPTIINDFLDFALPIYWGENEYTNFEQIAELWFRSRMKDNVK